MNWQTFLKTAGYAALAGLFSCCHTHNFLPQKLPSSKRVLIIGIDGLRPDALQQAATPNIDALVAGGAYSFTARTGTHTLSGPGWSNILAGVWENKHGVKDNTFVGVNYKNYPTLFTRIEDYKPNLHTYVVASLDWFTEFMLSKTDHRICHPFEKDGDQKAAETASRLLAYNKVDVMFVYFMGTDLAGHAYGFDPAVPEYLAEIETIDGYVGMLMGSLKKRPAYDKELWLTILTSDHGGKGKIHDGIKEAQKIPLIMYGSAVQKGELAPVPTQVDVVPTIMSYLDIPLRQEWGLDGKVVGLR